MVSASGYKKCIFPHQVLFVGCVRIIGNSVENQLEIGLNVTGGKLRSNRILRHNIEVDAIFCAEGTNDKGSGDRSTL